MVTPVHLDDIEAFREVLRDYKMSEHAKKVLHETRLVILSGVAGGGRNTVINYLTEHHGYFFLVSDTTRPPKLRSGVMEQDGVQYHFRKESELLDDLRQGEFVEAEIIHNQQVSGISVRELERANESGKIVINEVEFGGTQSIAAAKPDGYFIGLLPPDYDTWIKRFTEREVIERKEFINRMETAQKVLHNMLKQPYFKFVVNDSVAQCADDIREIVERGMGNDEKQQRAKQVAMELLDRVEQAL